jgi:serine/threonine-protein kinase
MVMDYVEGDVLSAILKAISAKKQVMPLRIALRILSDALAGLHAAHELKDDRGELLHVVHRDFSPQNILVGCDGTTRLTDFGIAKVANSDQRTATGLIKGKVRYMSPEQAHAEELDRRADVWSAAVVAWEVLAGQRMHPIADETAVLLRIVSEDATPIATWSKPTVRSSPTSSRQECSFI